MNFTSIIIKFAKNYLSNPENNDPLLLNRNKSYFYAISISIVLLRYLDIDTNLSFPQLKNVIEMTFSKKSLFYAILNTIDNTQKTHITSLSKKLAKVQVTNSLASEVYEDLLNYHFSIKENNSVQEAECLMTKSTGGVFYTPDNIAYASVKKAISSMNVSKGKISKISVVDPSCGTGQFLKQYLLFLKDELKLKDEALRQALLNCHGFDIDPIAIEVTKFTLALTLNALDLLHEDDLHNNFSHGNPLLTTTDSPIPTIDKINLSFSGYIYHPDLALTNNELTPKYDLIIGNPPWSKIRIEDKKFFWNLNKSISQEKSKAKRIQKISNLETESPLLHKSYNSILNNLESCKSDIKSNLHFKLTAKGELNTYALFTELSSNLLLKDNGYLSLLVKSGLFTTACYKDYFAHLIKAKKIISISDFINSKKIFNIDGRERFSLFIAGKNPNSTFKLQMGLVEAKDLFNPSLEVNIHPNDLTLINPITGMLPNISSPQRLELLIELAKNNSPFNDIYPDVNFGRIVHLTTHSKSIYKERKANTVPIYEGKFFNQYNGRFAGFNFVEAKDKYKSKASAQKLTSANNDQAPWPESRFFINEKKWFSLTKNYKEKYSLMWRSTTSATNTRTCIAVLLNHRATIQSVQLLQRKGSQHELLYILAVFNSIPFDYIVRSKLNGIDLTQTVIKQTTFPDYNRLKSVVFFDGLSASLKNHICARSYLLSKNDCDIENVYPSTLIDSISRNPSRLRQDLDILVSFAYGISPSQFLDIIKDFKKFVNENKLSYDSYIESWPQLSVIKPLNKETNSLPV
ncbi:N-6 DNA methylase [Halobacteriovorax sp. RZ-1]|uniref:Eco57I restriction-modification methylase domain-containing protein n=1 Tax=unclassified Halobacteriovorax TaxID=2639665 RepID=UPI003714322F